MTKQDCKFARGVLVSESHRSDLTSVYVALGCCNYFDRVDGVQVTRECAQGSEFCLYLGTMDKWGNDYDADTICVDSLIVSLPSNATHQWDMHMRKAYSSSLGPEPSDGSYIKWAWRVALWRCWDLSPGSLVHLSPICKATLGETEFSMLVDTFTAHFWLWPNTSR